MKTLLIALFTFLILFVSLPQDSDQRCDQYSAKRNIPSEIFSNTAIDGSGQPVVVTRFLHNKVGIYLSEFSRCYFNILDPNFLLQTTGPIGLIPILYLIYNAIVNKRFFIGLLILTLPLLSFFNLPMVFTVIALKVFAIIGVLFWFYF